MDYFPNSFIRFSLLEPLAVYRLHLAFTCQNYFWHLLLGNVGLVGPDLARFDRWIIKCQFPYTVSFCHVSWTAKKRCWGYFCQWAFALLFRLVYACHTQFAQPRVKVTDKSEVAVVLPIVVFPLCSATWQKIILKKSVVQYGPKFSKFSLNLRHFPWKKI